jgi:diguanylate cyclase (GGDEF)-like protein
MVLDRTRVSARFFAALAALLAMLVAVGLLGLLGLQSVEGADNQLFDDNFRTSQATSRFTADLGRVQRASLEIAAAPDVATVERLRAKLAAEIEPAVDADVAWLLRLHAADAPDELREFERVASSWRSFRALARVGSFVADGRLPSAAERAETVARGEQIIDPLLDEAGAHQAVEVKEATSAHARAQSVFKRSRNWLLLAALVALVAAAVLARAGGVLRRLLVRQAAERDYGASASEYVDVLQGTASEGEAQELLRRQIERVDEGSRAVVLIRNNSDDRLEARTSLAQLPALQERLIDAAPRSCLAVRFARGHIEGGGREPLASCELCGKLGGASVCEPLLVGGGVIGSVLVSHEDDPSADACRHIRESVAQAAPVLANLRNLALAELRAATDQLTGLPNHRGVQETLKLMVAQASRTVSPLAAILFDLDHFKTINDVYGHDSGDELLAAVGVAFRNTIRTSDFVGRYGGEEFLVLLPASSREGALQVAESVRRAIAATRVPSIDQPISTSAGVAIMPDDAGDAVTLFRAADRALYAAKRAGRNRVHVATAETDAPATAVDATPT